MPPQTVKLAVSNTKETTFSYSQGVEVGASAEATFEFLLGDVTVAVHANFNYEAQNSFTQTTVITTDLPYTFPIPAHSKVLVTFCGQTTHFSQTYQTVMVPEFSPYLIDEPDFLNFFKYMKGTSKYFDNVSLESICQGLDLEVKQLGTISGTALNVWVVDPVTTPIGN